jgi:hypothetical protein
LAAATCLHNGQQQCTTALFVNVPKEEPVKKTVLAFVVAAATGVALSAQAPAQTPSHASAVKQTAPKTATKSAKKEAGMSPASTKAKAKVETAEVVSTDAAAKSITVKPASGENQTYTAVGGAVKQLEKVKAGEQVRLTVRDNDVTSITMAHAKHAAMAKKAAPKKDTK